MMMKFCLALLVVFIVGPAPTSADIGGYLLMARNKTAGIDAFDYLTNTLVPAVKAGTISFDRLLLAFLDPSMDPDKITKETDPQKLLVDAGMISDPVAGDGLALKNAITALVGAKVRVYFSVGGWEYSCWDNALEKAGLPQPGCSSNFPLTNDIVQAFKDAKLDGDTSKIQPVAKHSSGDYADAWCHVVNVFGGSGIDLDSEEYWFAAETAYLYPVLARGGELPDGPMLMPYSVVKYAAWLKTLKVSAAKAKLSVTIAAPAMGAFDIHDNIGGCSFWCPVTKKNDPDTAVCGKSSRYKYKDIDVDGYMKGNFYDMANYKKINNMGYHFTYPESLMSGLLDGIDTIAPMTYDLDDGYDGVGGSWCIGMVNGHFSARDPNSAGYHNVDCAIAKQVEVLIKMWKKNVLSSSQVDLAFGLETGFPNYPINIDDDEPGGGTDISDPHYRWNDPFVVFDVPLCENVSAADMGILNKLKPKLQKSDSKNCADVHSNFLVLNKEYFTTMKQAGAKSLIVWSLYNDDYSGHLSADSWDYKQYQAKAWKSFGTDYSKYGYTDDILRILFTYAASPEAILELAKKYL